MTKTPDLNDEILTAYADGELEPDMRAAVERRIAADDVFAERVRRFKESRAHARDALAPLLREKVPEALSASVQDLLAGAREAPQHDGSNVIPLASGQRRAAPPAFARWAMPLAASVALVVGAAAGFVIGTSGTDEQPGLAIAGLGQAGVVTALDTIAAGSEDSIGAGERFRAIATYRGADGAVCREFEVDRADGSTIVAVACHPDAAWEVQFAVVARQASDGYAPASSLESLDAYLDAVGAGAPLSPEAERNALDALR